jgi:hypothetical protein
MPTMKPEGDVSRNKELRTRQRPRLTVFGLMLFFSASFTYQVKVEQPPVQQLETWEHEASAQLCSSLTPDWPREGWSPLNLSCVAGF